MGVFFLAYSIVLVILIGIPVIPWLNTTSDNRKELCKEYVEYESARLLARLWNDPDAIGECSTCGMDDAPILTNKWTSKFVVVECKWCRELNDLNYHLEHKGTRRLRKVKK